MKKYSACSIYTLLLIFCFGAFSTLQAQADKADPCDDLQLDLDAGTLNGLKGTATTDEVKKAFPCFTGGSEENVDGLNCGGGVFFLDHDFFFYTGRDYLNIRNKFPGKCTPTVLGLSVNEAFEALGKAVDEFDHTDILDETTTYIQFERKWGTLVLLAKEGNIYSVELHYGKEVGEIEFCF